MNDFMILLSDLSKSKIIFTFLFLLIAYLLKILFVKIAWKKIEQIQIRLVVRRIINVIFTLLVLIITTSIWITNFNQLGTFFGLFSAGVAIALKDPLVNVVGWLFIIMRRPFIIGDRIQISTYSGDVIDVSIFQTSILEIGNWVEAEQSTGRIIHLPNGIVFTQGVANYTKGFDYIWNELSILLTFESDWHKAKKLIIGLANDLTSSVIQDATSQIKNASQKYLIKYKNLNPIVYTSVKDSGVQLSLRYLCKVRERRSSENVLWESILQVFEKNEDLEFAYPTHRFYDRTKE